MRILPLALPFDDASGMALPILLFDFNSSTLRLGRIGDLVGPVVIGLIGHEIRAPLGIFCIRDGHVVGRPRYHFFRGWRGDQQAHLTIGQPVVERAGRGHPLSRGSRLALPR